MATLIGDISRGCSRALVIRLISIAIILPLAFCLLCLPIWAFSQFDMNPWLMFFSAAIFLVLIFGGMGIYIGYVLYKRKQMLDTIFSPLGLQGKPYLTLFRQYHGNWAGREVDVYLSRGPRLEIEINTILKTRLGVTALQSDTRFISELANRNPLSTENPALNKLLIYAHDETWARQLVADPQVATLLQRMTALTGTFTRQQIVLRPGAFQLLLTGNTQILTFNLEPAQTHQLIEDLLKLTEIAERLPSPIETNVLSSLEKSAIKLRRQNPYMTLWIGLGIFALIIIGAACIATIIVLLTSV
jgi:hypothetical protein